MTNDNLKCENGQKSTSFSIRLTSAHWSTGKIDVSAYGKRFLFFLLTLHRLHHFVVNIGIVEVKQK